MIKYKKQKDRYRFGFNGQEKVNEWSGIGNHLDFAFRGYDSRTGRWLSLDPAMAKYPGWSPYVFAFDNPIRYNDPKGDDPPTLEEIIAEGKKSTVFTGLMTANGIDNTNYNQIIQVSNRSLIDPDSRQINIKVRDLGTSVLSLTMEMTNRKNSDKYVEYQTQVKNGDITPEQYADRVLDVEAEGVFNKIQVAADLGIDDPENQDNIDALRNEAASPGQIRNRVNSSVRNARTKDTGESGRQQYIRKGTQMRVAHLYEEAKEKQLNAELAALQNNQSQETNGTNETNK